AITFDARHLAIAARRDVDPNDGAAGVGVRPRVFLAVIRPREADLLELAIRRVVLPPVDATVFILVDVDPDNTGAVHVAPGVDGAVVIRVVLQQGQLAGFVVVFRCYRLFARVESRAG